MANRARLCADLHITDARMAEPKGAGALIERQRRERVKLRSRVRTKVTAAEPSSGICESAESAITSRASSAATLLGSMRARRGTTATASASASEKRIEEIFGWLKAVDGLRKSRFIGIERTQLYAYLAASAYNLLRMARLAPAVTYTVVAAIQKAARRGVEMLLMTELSSKSACSASPCRRYVDRASVDAISGRR
jgi:hypothetical protein